jgi:hypothetical protein
MVFSRSAVFCSVEHRGPLEVLLSLLACTGTKLQILTTKCTCFIGTKIQILTQQTLWQGDWTIEVIVKRSQLVDGTQINCFTGTKVRILTQKALLGCAVSVLFGTSEFALSLDQAKGDPGENPQFTCCTRTKVQMLTDSAVYLRYSYKSTNAD